MTANASFEGNGRGTTETYEKKNAQTKRVLASTKRDMVSLVGACYEVRGIQHRQVSCNSFKFVPVEVFDAVPGGSKLARMARSGKNTSSGMVPYPKTATTFKDTKNASSIACSDDDQDIPRSERAKEARKGKNSAVYQSSTNFQDAVNSKRKRKNMRFISEIYLHAIATDRMGLERTRTYTVGSVGMTRRFIVSEQFSNAFPKYFRLLGFFSQHEEKLDNTHTYEMGRKLQTSGFRNMTRIGRRSSRGSVISCICPIG